MRFFLWAGLACCASAAEAITLQIDISAEVVEIEQAFFDPPDFTIPDPVIRSGDRFSLSFEVSSDLAPVEDDVLICRTSGEICGSNRRFLLGDIPFTIGTASGVFEQVRLEDEILPVDFNDLSQGFTGNVLFWPEGADASFLHGSEFGLDRDGPVSTASATDLILDYAANPLSLEEPSFLAGDLTTSLDFSNVEIGCAISPFQCDPADQRVGTGWDYDLRDFQIRVAVVPLPPVLPALLLGLGALGAMRLRQTRR